MKGKRDGAVIRISSFFSELNNVTMIRMTKRRIAQPPNSSPFLKLHYHHFLSLLGTPATYGYTHRKPMFLHPLTLLPHLSTSLPFSHFTPQPPPPYPPPAPELLFIFFLPLLSRINNLIPHFIREAILNILQRPTLLIANSGQFTLEFGYGVFVGRRLEIFSNGHALDGNVVPVFSLVLENLSFF